ncbi:IclR family transcriptional regulator C-terminal domain-containing protein [Nonomuraea wenchangensis]
MSDSEDEHRLVGSDRVLAVLAELARHPPSSIATVEELHAELVRVREQGYAVDDQENEPGVHCVAVAAFLTSPSVPSGAVSVTGLAYRTSLRTLIDDLPAIRAIVNGSTALTPVPYWSKENPPCT